MTRTELLKQLITEDPADPFLRYGLALEYLHHQPLLAREVFEFLLSGHPRYLPTYYPAAHLFVEQGDAAKGEKVFQMGIELAKELGDRKTERELKQAYEQWLAEREDN